MDNDDSHNVSHHFNIYISRIVSESIMFTRPVPDFKKKIVEHCNVKVSLKMDIFSNHILYLSAT